MCCNSAPLMINSFEKICEEITTVYNQLRKEPELMLDDEFGDEEEFNATFD